MARRKTSKLGTGWRRWLGLGALAAGGAALAWLTRREPMPQTVDDLGFDRFERADEAAETDFTLPADSHESWLAGPSGTIRIVERNRGGQHTVLFVHGLGGCLEHWAGQLAALPPSLHGVAVDLPGHGGSEITGDPAELTVPMMAHSLGAVTDALGVRRLTLVAHSYGATVATAWAGSAPRRVAGLFLVDPNGDQTKLDNKQRDGFLGALRSDTLGELRWHFSQILVGSQPQVRERVLMDLEQVDPETLLRLTERSVEYSPLTDLDRYTGPTHALISEMNDLETSLHRLRPALPASKILGASHWLMLDKPATFNRVLADFLDEVRDRLAGSRPVPVVDEG
ncbi:MAG: alpha/beta fold hydrolase [Acidobacteriota bacterium]